MQIEWLQPMGPDATWSSVFHYKKIPWGAVCVCGCVCVLKPEIGSLIETRIYQKERKKSWVVALFTHSKSFLGSVKKTICKCGYSVYFYVRRIPLQHPSNTSSGEFHAI